MFDVPVDAWYVWVALAVASTTALGVATQFPSQPPPDAAGVARTVDSVAASPYPASATHPLDAEKIKLGPRRITLSNDGETAHASFSFGPVTPVHQGTLLWEVLRGARPAHVFESPARFERAAAAARQRTPTWRRASSELRVRRVTWEDVDVTIVSA